MMRGKAVRKAAILFIFLPILSACGDMGTLFTPSTNYHVRASVNGLSLEDSSSLLRSGDRILPYFAVSVDGDPDVTGLLVYIRNEYGEIIGNRVRFVIGFPVAETETPESGDYGEPVIEAVSPGMDLEVVVRSFDAELPYISLSQTMEIGLHTLVFEVLGGVVTLHRTEIPVFYLGNAEFSIRDISMALPGLFMSRLVPPGTRVLLEARLDFDDRLDPFLVWRSGRNIIHQGRARDGADGILWDVPSQTAFHPLRLEVIPFTPVGFRRNFIGISREILLPVSANAESPGFFFGTGPGNPARNRLAEGMFHMHQVFMPATMQLAGTENGYGEEEPEPPELYLWYQFEGRLHDTTSPRDEDRFLVPAEEEGTPFWTSIGHSYGLSTGDDDAFLLPPVNFFREDRDHGGGIFLFHVRPVAEGTILSAFFPSDSPFSGGAWIDLSRNGNAVMLRIGTPETTIEMPVFLSDSELRSLIPFAVKFYIDPHRLEANLSLGENAFLQSTAQSVTLSDPLTGEGRIRLGGTPMDYWTHTLTRVFTELVHLTQTPVAEEEPPDAPPEIDFPVFHWEGWEDIQYEDWQYREDILEPMPPDETPPPPPEEEAEIETVGRSLTTVWNEFAVMFSSVPFPRFEYETGEYEEYAEETEEGAEPAEDYSDAVPVVADAEAEDEPEYIPAENGATLPNLTEAEAPEDGLGAILDESLYLYTEAETLAVSL